jgi:DNA-binding PucR family transcriptional regulator
VATKAVELYEDDFFAWTRDQAAALRRLEKERWNGPLDLAHLAEEIEDVGSERRDAVRSQIRRILEHLLKLEHSQATDPRFGWRDSIIDARAEISDKLTRTLRRDIASQLPRLYERSRAKAANGLASYGERDGARALPLQCPYQLEAILHDAWYPANHHGIVDEPD